MLEYIKNDLERLKIETFEIEDLEDLGFMAPQELLPSTDGSYAAWCSSSCSCSSCCSCSTSSCCSTSTSTGCGGGPPPGSGG